MDLGGWLRGNGLEKHEGASRESEIDGDGGTHRVSSACFLKSRKFDLTFDFVKLLP